MERSRADSGTAIVGTVVGFLIFTVLLLLATQVLVRLYATSALTSAATRAAEDVASAPDPVAGVPAAEADARSRLGSFGATRTVFTWREVDGGQVVLEVAGRSPEFLPGLPGWSRIDRTVIVRTERFR
jgi:predicted cobalt transporter CbtA